MSTPESTGSSTEHKGDSFGIGHTDRLDAPVKNDFGVVSEVKTYPDGAELGAALGDELSHEPGRANEILLTIETNGVPRTVAIGNTPDRWNPNEGGSLIEGAGDLGKYLMVIEPPAVPGNPDPGETLYRYLGSENIQGVEAWPGGELITQESPILNDDGSPALDAKGKPRYRAAVRVAGKVKSVQLYR